MLKQKTIKNPVSLEGIGVHGGQASQITFSPAIANTGIIFRRTDVKNPAINQIQATWQHVIDTCSCTTLANAFHIKVRTVEHVMAALTLLGINNVIIDVTSEELPIMDGSAQPFIEALQTREIQDLPFAKKHLRLLKEVTIQEPNGSHGTLKPAEDMMVDVTMNLSARASVIGCQVFKGAITEASYKDIGPARTFGFYEDAEKLWALGFAKGASLDNTVVIRDNAIMNDEGCRFENECARHKVLDAIGDLALSGYDLLGHYEAFNPGHTLNHKLLCALFADATAYEVVN